MKRPKPTQHGRHADRFVPLDGKSRAVHYWRHSAGVCPKHKPGRHRAAPLPHDHPMSAMMLGRGGRHPGGDYGNTGVSRSLIDWPPITPNEPVPW